MNSRGKRVILSTAIMENWEMLIQIDSDNLNWLITI